MSKVHFHLLGMNGFHVKADNGRFTAVGLHCYQNLKYENFTSLLSVKNCTKKQNACVGWLFFLIQPWVCGINIVIAVAIVNS